VGSLGLDYICTPALLFNVVYRRYPSRCLFSFNLIPLRDLFEDCRTTEGFTTPLFFSCLVFSWSLPPKFTTNRAYTFLSLSFLRSPPRFLQTAQCLIKSSLILFLSRLLNASMVLNTSSVTTGLDERRWRWFFFHPFTPTAKYFCLISPLSDRGLPIFSTLLERASNVPPPLLPSWQEVSFSRERS